MIRKAANHFFVLLSTLLIVFFACESCWSEESSDSASAKEKQPNFVVILVDDLGWNDLGCYGSTFYETPHLDRFAKQSVRFTNAYAAGSVCSPTRAALMCGAYPPRVQITDWIKGRGDKNRPLSTPKIRHELPLEKLTIAEHVKKLGYATCFVGKWHLGSTGYFPEDQGFDLNFGGHRLGSPPGGYYSPYKNPKLKNGPEGEYLPDRLTNESIKFIEANKDKPFLLYLSFYTVHTPIQPCKRHLEKFQKKRESLPPLEDSEAFQREHEGWSKVRQDNAKYASMVYAMDENVGRLLKALKDHGVEDNTTVIFTSDNGGLCTLPRKGAPTSIAPLRAGKGWLYEGGIRVPLMIRTAGKTRAGKACHQPVISMDVFHTVLAQASNDVFEGDGIDLTQFLEKPEKNMDRTLYWHYPHYHGSAWKPGSAIRKGKWKLLRFYESEKVELYDLEADPGETNDVSAKFPKQKARLLGQFESWAKDVGAEMPSRKNSGTPKKR